MKRLQRRSPAASTRLQLTAMVDVMTLLLLFLLHIYEGEVSASQATGVMNLPEAVHVSPDRPAVTVTVTADAMFVDGKLLYDERPGGTLDEGDQIVHLRATLQNWRSRTPSLLAVTIQSDRDVAFGRLKRVLRVCRDSGFTDLSLLVRRRAR